MLEAPRTIISIKLIATSCGEDDKFLLAYVFFKLGLIKGKCLIFVADVDRSYRLRLFLEQFGIKSCVLNPEMPITTRLHIVEQFNRNIYDIIIACDDSNVGGLQSRTKTPSMSASGEYSAARGVDFHHVSTVLNFDFPVSATSYTHRVGRTARAGRTGTTLSFVVPKELYRKHAPTSIPSAQNDEDVLADVEKDQTNQGRTLKPYVLDKQQLEPFRYRFGDALRNVTKLAVRGARVRELKHELLKSEKLKRHMEEDPTVSDYLRHDSELRIIRQQPHLKHVPGYLLPTRDTHASANQDGVSLLSRGSGTGIGKRRKVSKPKSGSRKKDPLRSFTNR